MAKASEGGLWLAKAWEGGQVGEQEVERGSAEEARRDEEARNVFRRVARRSLSVICLGSSLSAQPSTCFSFHCSYTDLSV